MTAAVFGIVGVVVGGLLNFFLQWWQEERRWKREDELRDHEQRRQVYAQFLTVRRRILNGDESEGALEEFRNLMDTIGLIAPREVDVAAYDLYQLTDRALRHAILEANNTDEQTNSVAIFRDAARADLGKPRMLNNDSQSATQ